MKNISIFHNSIIDNCARSIIVYNSILKTYKVMLDENLTGIFEKFILNNCFSNILFGNLKENSQEMTDEFVSGDKVNDETRNYVLTIHCRELQRHNFCSLVNNDKNHRYGNWQIIYPPIFSGFAKAKKWDWVKKMIELAR